jgi:hypothetical protein
LACLAEVPLGSDTGHHADLTRDALQEAGFQPDAIRIVQMANWLTAFYSSVPSVGLNTNFAEIRAEVEKLHFDNIDGKLADTDSVARYWSHLTKNTHDAVKQAATDGNALKLLTVLGISLHAPQDFYSHSNWVEMHPRAENGPLRTETWFTELAGGPKPGLRTGRFPDVDDEHPELNHGKYTTPPPGMNHDSYVRPRWKEAYAFAFAATIQWVRAAREWAGEGDPSVWARAQSLAATAGLDADIEASFRIAEWISLQGNDGHWKGNGSGTLAQFAIIFESWTTSTDSQIVAQFKQAKVHTLLTPGLYTATGATAVPAVRRVAIRRNVIFVQTLEVQAKDDLDLTETAIDPLGSPDFYAVVTVAGNSYTEAMQLDSAKIKPAWTSTRFLPVATDTVPIVYALFDEDGLVRSNDDHCDINPDAGTLDLTLSFQRSEGSRLVNSAGAKPDRDRASVSLRITTDALAPFPPLSITASVGTDGQNDKADVAIVQELLNAVPADQGGPASPLVVDGLIGPNTINAINAFQMKQLGFQDGRVDPGFDTIKRLNEF